MDTIEYFWDRAFLSLLFGHKKSHFQGFTFCGCVEDLGGRGKAKKEEELVLWMVNVIIIEWLRGEMMEGEGGFTSHSVVGFIARQKLCGYFFFVLMP